MPDNFNFMNSPDFGAPGGIIANQSAQMNALSMQQMPAKLQHTMAETRLALASAGLKEEELAGAKDMGAIWGKAMSGAGQEASPGVITGTAAVEAFKMGHPVQGMKLLTSSREFMNSEASIQAHKATQHHAQLQSQISELDLGARLLGEVTDQASQDRVAKEWPSHFGGEQAPFAGMPFNAARIDSYKARGLSEKDKVNNDFKVAREADLEENRRTRNELTATLRDIQQQNADRADRSADLKAKGGGKVLSDVAKVDVDSVLAMAKKDHPDVSFGKEGDAFARSVAFDAKKMRAANPAIDPEVARFRAYQARKGELEIGKTWYGGTGDAKFKSTKTGTQAEPYAITEQGSREVGKFYDLGGGRIMQWAEEGSKKGWKAE